ncbi:MAG: hypothetical protein Q7R48_03680 [bacterium]|nr:hypothetical protein [bacterium]
MMNQWYGMMNGWGFGGFWLPQLTLLVFLAAGVLACIWLFKQIWKK